MYMYASLSRVSLSIRISQKPVKFWLNRFPFLLSSANRTHLTTKNWTLLSPRALGFAFSPKNPEISFQNSDFSFFPSFSAFLGFPISCEFYHFASDLIFFFPLVFCSSNLDKVSIFASRVRIGVDPLMEARDLSSSSSSAAANRDGPSPAEDDAVLSVAAALSKDAALHFQSGKLAECVEVLNQLLLKKPDDPKVIWSSSDLLRFLIQHLLSWMADSFFRNVLLYCIWW